MMIMICYVEFVFYEVQGSVYALSELFPAGFKQKITDLLSICVGAAGLYSYTNYISKWMIATAMKSGDLIIHAGTEHIS